MKLANESRLILIGILLIISSIFIIYPFLVKRSGVTILSVSSSSACREILLPGSVVTKINQKDINNADDFYSIVNDLEGRVNLMVNEGPRICEINSGEKIDLKVMNFEKSGIKFGIEIKGGKEIILESSDVSKSLSVIEKRIKSHEFENINLNKISDDSYGIVFGLDDEYKVDDLLEPGVVSFRFIENIEIKNNTGKFLLNDKSYDLKVNNNSIELNEKNYKSSDEFILDGINIKVENITANYTSFFLDVFDDRDVHFTNINQNSGLSQIKTYYRYFLVLGLSEQAGKNFEKVTKGQPVIINPQGENYLQDQLGAWVDEKLIATFPIFQSSTGKAINETVLLGIENKRETADKKLHIFSTLLESGRLPDSKIVERKNVEPERKNLLKLTSYFIIGIFVVSCVYGFVRFKNIKVVCIIFGLGVTEILMFLGVISSQTFTIILALSSIIMVGFKGEIHGWMGWLTILLMFLVLFGAVVNKLVVDSYTLFGFIFGYLVSLVYLMILSENLTKSSKKYEKTFDYIWKISFVIIAVLTIIFFLKTYKDFAIASTIILISSIALTKPEYARLVEKSKKS